MNKKVSVVLGILLVLSVMQVALVLAESGSGSSDDSGIETSTSDSDDDNDESEDEVEIETEDDGRIKMEEKTRVGGVKREIKREIRDGKMVEEIKEEWKNESGEFKREIRQEIRTMAADESQRRILEFKMKMRDRNGTIEVESENNQKFRIRIDGLDEDRKEIIAGKINARTGLNLSAEDIGNGTTGEILRAYLSNGRFAEVKVLPDRAAAVAVARMKAKCEERNCTVELKEIEGKNNQTRAAYVVSTDKESRVLFVFKKKMAVRAEVDSETGEVVLVKKPWWAFLAKEKNEDSEVDVEDNADDESSENENAAGGTVEANTNATGNLSS